MKGVKQALDQVHSTGANTQSSKIQNMVCTEQQQGRRRGTQVEADYGRPKDGLGRVVSEHDLQALAVERGPSSKGAYAGVKHPSSGMGNQPGPLTLLVKVDYQVHASPHMPCLGHAIRLGHKSSLGTSHPNAVVYALITILAQHCIS